MKYIVNVLIPNTLMQQRLDYRRNNWKPFGNINTDYSTTIGDEVFMEMVNNKTDEKTTSVVKNIAEPTEPAEPAVYVPTRKKKDTGEGEEYDPTKLSRKTRKITRDRNDNKLINL